MAFIVGSVVFAWLFGWLLCYSVAQYYMHVVYVLPMRNRGPGARQRLKRIQVASSLACMPDFRQLLQGLTICALVLRVVWLIDPAGAFGIFPIALEHLLLRLPQVIVLLEALLVVLLWRRLVSSATNAELIKSAVMVGRYKYVVAGLVLLLAVLTVTSLLGALDISPDIMAWTTRVLFCAFLIGTLFAGCIFARQFEAELESSEENRERARRRASPFPTLKSFRGALPLPRTPSNSRRDRIASSHTDEEATTSSPSSSTTKYITNPNNNEEEETKQQPPSSSSSRVVTLSPLNISARPRPAPSEDMRRVGAKMRFALLLALILGTMWFGLFLFAILAAPLSPAAYIGYLWYVCFLWGI